MFVIVYLSHGWIWRLCFIATSESARPRASGIGIRESEIRQTCRLRDQVGKHWGIDVLLNFLLFVLQSQFLSSCLCRFEWRMTAGFEFRMPPLPPSFGIAKIVQSPRSLCSLTYGNGGCE